MRKLTKKKFWLLVIILVAVFLWWFFKIDRHNLRLKYELVPDNFWGVTFSTKYARELSLEPREVYLAMLDDLQVKKIRLPVYWDEVETAEGVFDFKNYDWLINEGENRKVQFILVLGRRSPRWPECHTPNWAQTLDTTAIQQAELESLAKQIDHFRQFSSIKAWQVQNEFYFKWFGICPETDDQFLQKQLALLKSKDTRPVVMTDSGEFSLWSQVGKRADIVGTTMYRVAWNKYLGYLYSAWPAWNYQLKSKLIHKNYSQMIVAELQAEPWPADFGHVKDQTFQQAEQSFNLAQLETNSELARRTHFAESYFWGVEWWYWMKQKGQPEYWELAKKIIASAND